jgi:hypothetical protein
MPVGTRVEQIAILGFVSTRYVDARGALRQQIGCHRPSHDAEADYSNA